MIQGIIFDFGGVLCTFDSRLFFQALAGRTDRTAGEMAALVLASDLPRRYESGQISSREFFTAVTKPCGLSISEEEFFQGFDYDTIVQDADPDPAYNMPDTYQQPRELRLTVKFEF